MFLSRMVQLLTMFNLNLNCSFGALFECLIATSKMHFHSYAVD